ncbi:MAG: ribosome biogenesis GTPase YlqF [Firmicutes bacterium]|nr:ribosome biogenesis GTPase YlqF [Bacillota bacterium]
MSQRGVLVGHMARVRGRLRQLARAVDLVWEVVDARAPWSTRNVQLAGEFGGRPRWLVLAKADLADEARTAEWLRYFSARDVTAVAVAAAGPRPDVEPLLLRAREARGAGPRLRVLVAGIPNVGKSSLINRLAGRAKAATGARPGITRGEQWIRLDDFDLLDTPGILPPTVGRGERAAKLRALDCLSEEQWPAEEAAVWLIAFFQRERPRTLEVHYGLEDERGEPADVLAAIGRRRGALAAGGQVDIARAAEILLGDFRRGKLGAVTLETPGDAALPADGSDAAGARAKGAGAP